MAIPDKNERGALHMDVDREEVAIFITNDGEVTILQTFPDKPPEELPPHVWIAEGICKALLNPDLYDDLRDLCERAHDDGEKVPVEHPPLLN